MSLKSGKLQRFEILIFLLKPSWLKRSLKMEYFESVSIGLGLLIVLTILLTMSVPAFYYFYFLKRLEKKHPNETFILVSVLNNFQTKCCRSQSEGSSASQNDIPWEKNLIIPDLLFISKMYKILINKRRFGIAY